jgi:hypothetical protein
VSEAQRSDAPHLRVLYWYRVGRKKQAGHIFVEAGGAARAAREVGSGEADGDTGAMGRGERARRAVRRGYDEEGYKEEGYPDTEASSGCGFVLEGWEYPCEGGEVSEWTAVHDVAGMGMGVWTT